MKILHILPSVNPEDGGIVEGVRQLMIGYQSLDVDIEVACCDAPNDPWVQDSIFPVVHAMGPSCLGIYKYTPRLTKWLKEHADDYDAVIIDGIWQFNCFGAWLGLRKSKTPYFVFTHGMLDPWFKKTYPLKHIKKWLFWPWSVYPVLKNATAILFTCEEEKLLARQSFWLYSATEEVSSYGTMGPPNDINAKAAADVFLSQFPETKYKQNILFLSRIHEKKGCDLLIEAFADIAAKHPKAHLIMAGPDQTGWADTLKARANELGLSDRISWTGMLKNEMKWGAYYASDVFCLPSHQENFGIVVVESLACGKTVLISNKVNIWREIEEYGAGFVSSDTVEGTIKNLNQWFALSPDEKTKMNNIASQCFHDHFTIVKSAEKLTNIIRKYLRTEH